MAVVLTDDVAADTTTIYVSVSPLTILQTALSPALQTPVLFPNPNHGTFEVNIPAVKDEEAHIKITDMPGNKVKEFSTTTNRNFTINLSQPAGFYLINVSTATDNYLVKMEIMSQ